MGWNVASSLADKIAQASEKISSLLFLTLVLAVGAIVDVILYAFNILTPNVSNWIAGTFILLSPALYLLIGFDRSRSTDPVRRLFDQPGAKDAGYLLSRAAILHQNKDISFLGRRAALRELAKELDPLKNELKYINKVINDVETHAVWAVCGRKTKRGAPSFYKANVDSFERKPKGNYIERVFLPPTTDTDEKSIREAIEDYHFPTGMLVRALKPERNADEVRAAHDFPPGFGMTIMGTCVRPDHNPQCDPDEKCAVLIHWGGVDTASAHFGVILKGEAWLEYFWGVFTQMRDGVTDIVNPGGVAPTWNDFVAEYPAYEL